MKLSRKRKFELFALLVMLNIILRFQIVSHEIGADSFLMHIMVNSLNEYGYAKWLLHPLSIFGLYPASYTSTMQFLLSGISQCTGMEMRWIIFLYCMFIGLLSMFTAYLMAGEIIGDDMFKLLVAFGFSTSPGVLGYTTWTIPTRGLFVVLAPLVVYLLLKCRTSLKYVPLTFLLVIFLSATHHLFYFLIPTFFAFFFLSICFKLRKHINIKIPEKFATFVPITGLIPFISITGFLCMFSIPFFTGRFIEHSRYASIDVSYVRYIGILIIFAISGLGYLIFKRDKDFREWFLLLTLIFLTTFIYETTYMKWFLPIFAILLAGIGLLNILRTSKKRKIILPVVAIFLLMTVSFSAYYQFVHFLPESGTSTINERYIEESTYKTGRWMKENIINSSAISNDETFGYRIFAASEIVHLRVPSALIAQIYGFVSVNVSEFERRKITEEDFWFGAYKGPGAVGEGKWAAIHKLRIHPHEYNINYLVENRRCKGNLYWHHGTYPSKLLHFAYENDCIYDCGGINIWYLD